MKIELKKVRAKELFEGFVNSDAEGVLGYGGKLNIRPKYQRNFVYSQAQQDAVIDTISRGYPLNVMYWVANADGTFELLDGQQRTLSVCAYMAGDFAVTCGGELRGYANLLPEQRAAIDGYELMVYVCSDGTDKEKLDWFQTINIAGGVCHEGSPADFADDADFGWRRMDNTERRCWKHRLLGVRG